MALTSFRVSDIKALSLAECERVPKIMVIAGPNGVGKSTLLFEISQRRGAVVTDGTKMLYQPPHRAIRKTTVQRRWLGGQVKYLEDLLSQQSVSGYEGLSIQFPSRTPDNVDEAGSTIKYTLGKIENKRQSVIAELVDQSKTDGINVDTSLIPDIYQPLRELTKYLLPHLIFEKVDFGNEDDIRCVWTRKDRQREIKLDIDDLSSGEKSIIILFLPLLESDINHLLKDIRKRGVEAIAAPAQIPDRVFVIDEPELHLHPDLQSKILTYVRTLAENTNIQFILSTHSPTILDQALDSELFVLAFSTGEADFNQLKRVATSLDRLEALKQIAGDTYLVTTGRSIVCIEGDASAVARPADIRLFQILYPRSTAFTFIPVGGKGEVIKVVEKLREYLPEQAFGIKVFGLTDLDQTHSTVAGVYSLPVCMIENLLLEPESLYKYLVSKGVTDFTSAQSVEQELTKIASTKRGEEVSYRVMRSLGAYTVRLKGTNSDEIKASLDEGLNQSKRLLPEEAQLTRLVDETKVRVEQIITENRTLRSFRGKAIIEAFYAKYVSAKNIPYAEFCYEVAELIAQTDKISNILNPVFDALV